MRRRRARALYNEVEPYAAAWLANLIGAGHIASGDVDGRDVRELRATDLAGYEQAHFFAGIGTWSHALRLAGWPDDRPVWTGSCPCQPFSSAGQKRGFDDERHLWPIWFELIAQCRPPVVLGEQVASPDGLRWFDLVSSDLEGAGYAVGAADLCAAGVGAPHIRQRLYWVAVADRERREGQRVHVREGRPRAGLPEAARSGAPRSMADSQRERGREGRAGEAHGRSSVQSDRLGPLGVGLADANNAGLEGRELGRDGADERAAREGGVAGFWTGAEWLPCRDGKSRPTQPDLLPLADGAPARVGRLRAYGNAIVPQVAALFIETVMEWLDR